jgi:hypothetical protein
MKNSVSLQTDNIVGLEIAKFTQINGNVKIDKGGGGA